MSTISIFPRLLFAMSILACSTAVAAPDRQSKQTDILSLMPDNTLAFVVVNDPALLLTKTEALAKQLELPMPDPLALLQKQLPAVEHVDKSRPVAVVVHPDGMPLGGLYLVPVTDFEAFVKACGAEDPSGELVKVEFAGDEMVAASYRRYALITDASDASAIAAVKSNRGKVAAEYAAMRERMETADVAGGATRLGIEKFAAMAKQGIAAMQAKLEAMDPDDMPGVSPKSIAEAMSMYTLLVEAFDATVETYAFEVTIGKKAITGQDILRLKSGEFATKLGQIDTAGTDWCGQLPAARPVFVMAGTMPESLMPGLLEFSKKTMLAMKGLYGLDENQINRMIEDMKPVMEKTKGMAFLMAVPRNEDAPLYAGAGGLLKVDGGAQQYIEEYTTLLAKMAREMKKPSRDAMLSFSRPKKIDVDGKAGVRFDVDIDFSVGAEDSEQSRMIDEMMAKMYGPDGKLRVFLVAANDDTVAFGYTSLATVKRFIAAANGELPRTLDSVPAYKQLKAHLPDNAQWVGAIDLGGYFELIKRMMPPNMIPDLDVPAAPIGIGVKASEQEICVHGAVTVNSIKRLVQLLPRKTPPTANEQ